MRSSPRERGGKSAAGIRERSGANGDSRCTRATFRLPSIRAEIKSSASGARASTRIRAEKRAIGGSNARAGLLITGGGRIAFYMTRSTNYLRCEICASRIVGSAPDVTGNRSVGGGYKFNRAARVSFGPDAKTDSARSNGTRMTKRIFAEPLH
jgi:hypothetical protein